MIRNNIKFLIAPKGLLVLNTHISSTLLSYYSVLNANISSIQISRFYSSITNSVKFNSKFAPWKVDTNNIPLTIDLVDSKAIRYHLFYNEYKLAISTNITDFGSIINSNDKGHYYINFNNNNIFTLILIKEDNKLIYKLYVTKTNRLVLSWMNIILENNKFTRIIGNSIYNFIGNRLIKYEINNSVKKLTIIDKVL